MGAAVIAQTGFRGRDDDVGLNTDTWNGGSGGVNNTDWTQDVDVNFRVRFIVEETGGGMAANSLFILHFDIDGGGFSAVTATSAIQSAATIQYADGDTTTQVIGGGTYVTGESLGGVDDALVTGNMDLLANNQAEIEFCLTIDSAQVADEEVITLRVLESGDVDLNPVPAAEEPNITVNEAAPPGLTVGEIIALKNREIRIDPIRMM